jgi:hypothetical protein
VALLSKNREKASKKVALLSKNREKVSKKRALLSKKRNKTIFLSNKACILIGEVEKK